jgi:hypothetical protein
MTECDDPLQCQCYAANTGLTFQPMRTTQLKLILSAVIISIVATFCISELSAPPSGTGQGNPYVPLK